MSIYCLNSAMLRSHCRAIRCECHNWPFVADRGRISLKFQAWIRSDASRYVLIWFAAHGCDHGWSISGDTIWNDLISRSDRITYVRAGLSWSIPRWGVNLIRSSRLGVPDLGRCGTRIYVHLEPTRSVVTGYDCGLEIFHDRDQG